MLNPRLVMAGLALIGILAAPPLAAAPPGPGGGGVRVLAGEEVEVRQMVGVVRPQGPSIFMQGTHVLEDDQGRVIALLAARGTGVDLEGYVGKRVRVEGTVEPSVEGQMPFMNVARVSKP